MPISVTQTQNDMLAKKRITQATLTPFNLNGDSKLKTIRVTPTQI